MKGMLDAVEAEHKRQMQEWKTRYTAMEENRNELLVIMRQQREQIKDMRALLEPVLKTAEVVRGKKKRKALPVATDCGMCSEYYAVLAEETNVPRSALVNKCTRHRSKFPEPSTPEGYWDVGMSPPTKRK